jgi:mono/diheme cytochrome c family protein
MKRRCLVSGLVLSFLVPLAYSFSAEEDAVERGKKALQQRTFVPASWTIAAYQNAWKEWGNVKEAPADYTQAFMDHYGLHPAPFDNGGYPMGVRPGKGLLGGKGIATDCLLCHGGSIAGKSYIGLGNASLDIQAFFEDLGKGSGGKGKTPFIFSNVRGTSEAGSMAVFLLSYREPDLRLRLTPRDLGLRDVLCEDVPAWWLLKKKKTMYYTGTTHARSVRSLMQFMLTPLNSAATIMKEEPTFADIQAYLLSLPAPKYPFPINQALARKGEKLFGQHCAKCHGTYGEKWTYPNKIVPIDVIGTDRTRFDGLSFKAGAYYNKTWFAKEKPGWFADDYLVKKSIGYQAPPLDGVWATAPYFHNGSVPTLYHVLNSKARPKIFTRSYRTGKEDYDTVKAGWKVQVLQAGADPKLPPYERRKIYDTTQPGRGNGGHTFGDVLSEENRWAVIEYLKTL